MILKVSEGRSISIELTRKTIFNDAVPFVNCSFFVNNANVGFEYCVYDGNVYRWERAANGDRDKVKHHVFPFVRGKLKYSRLEDLNGGAKLFEAVMSGNITNVFVALEGFYGNREAPKVAVTK